MPPNLTKSAVPAAFVTIWATGFIVARAVAPYAEPLTFLTIRFAGASAVLAAIALAAGAPWPRDVRAWTDAALAGTLLHGVYLGCVFWAVGHGLPAGIAALIVGAQPLLVALLAQPLLRERVSGRRWFGVALGFAGLLLVLGPRVSGGNTYAVTTIAVAILALVGITAGTLWQKWTGGRADLRSGTAVQFAGAFVMAGAGAVATETMRVDPAPTFWLALAWAVGGLSIGAILLLLLMLRRGEAVAVSSLMFLVPPVTALMGYAIFGETLTGLQIAGMVVCTAGVALAGRA